MTTTAKPTSDFLTTAVQSAKRRIFSQVPNKKQVDLVSDGSVKRRTKWVLFTAAFIDLSGAVLLAGSYQMMCANAPGATPMGLVPGAFPASDFGAANATLSNATLAPPALDFAMTINLITVSNQAGGVFSNFLTGIASDRFGRKIVIQGCLIGGILSYIFMFAAGYWARSYYPSPKQSLEPRHKPPLLIGFGLACPRLPMAPTPLKLRLAPHMALPLAAAAAAEPLGVHGL